LFVGLFGNPGHTLASAGFHPAQILLAKKTKKDFYSTKRRIVLACCATAQCSTRIQETLM
jgi:hypothetical protein